MSTALVLLALAALGGIGLTLLHLKKDDAPLSVAAVHGILGAAGLGVLLWTVLQTGASSLVWASVVLFVLAALVGFVLITKHLRGESLTSTLMFTHGGAAVVAFVLLLIAYLG